LSGSITTSPVAGDYYAPNDINITGNVTLSNSRVLIADGKTMFVYPAKTLSIDGSHLFGMCGNVNGIVLNSTRPASTAQQVRRG
jgi:hypothetical protein